jgi:DNA (cytosine-5)-methyltransferase 1
MKRYTAVSLFSGIGGIDLAFTWAGFNIIAQVEIDKYCRRVLAKHAPQYWPDAIQLEDVRNVGKHNLPATDVIFGGFPCQPVSLSGKRKAQSDVRWMWGEFARVIGETRPRYVLLENVPGICAPLKQSDGRILPAPGLGVLADLATLGYDAEWGIVSAANVGAPHRRDRWFCVAYPNGNRQLSKRIAHESPHNAEWDTSTHQQAGNSVVRENITSNHVFDTHSKRLARQENVEGNEAQTFTLDYSTDSRGATRNDGDESGMGIYVHYGLSARLAEIRRVTQWAAPFMQPQYDYEVPRLAPETKNWKDEVKANGNSVVPQAVYPFAQIIRTLLEKKDGLR